MSHSFRESLIAASNPEVSHHYWIHHPHDHHSFLLSFSSMTSILSRRKERSPPSRPTHFPLTPFLNLDPAIAPSQTHSAPDPFARESSGQSHSIYATRSPPKAVTSDSDDAVKLRHRRNRSAEILHTIPGDTYLQPPIVSADPTSDDSTSNLCEVSLPEPDMKPTHIQPHRARAAGVEDEVEAELGDQLHNLPRDTALSPATLSGFDTRFNGSNVSVGSRIKADKVLGLPAAKLASAYLVSGLGKVG